jgi:hypothetical protein
MKGTQRSGGSGNLKKVAGGPNPSDIQSINDAAHNAMAGNNYVVNNPNQQSTEFPYIPFAQDQYDDIANIKRQFVAGGAEAVVSLDKDDAEHLLRQRAQVENADFDRWLMAKYDLTDPAQNFLMQQIAPQQFQRRLDLIDAQQSMVSKYARMRLMGPKDLNDLKFEWLIETGRVQLPKGPIWDPVAWMTAQTGAPNNTMARVDAMAQRYQAGLFSPLGWLTEDNAGDGPNMANRFDIRGNPNTKLDGQIYQGSQANYNPYMRPGTNPMWTDMMMGYHDDTPGVVVGYQPYAVEQRRVRDNPGAANRAQALTMNQRMALRQKQYDAVHDGGNMYQYRLDMANYPAAAAAPGGGAPGAP